MSDILTTIVNICKRIISNTIILIHFFRFSVSVVAHLMYFHVFDMDDVIRCYTASSSILEFHLLLFLAILVWFTGFLI